MKINQNISAVIVNDQLLRNENSVAASVKRLSSGLKFNDAKDNPSGIAISFKMQAQINALNRASLNATDGTSMVETIDGAMGEMTEVLQRIRELCVQAANDTNMDEDREAIQQEIDALKEEVNRISSATEFNGKTLLDGSLDRRTYVTSMVTPPAGGAAEEKSMYDKISNVIISDEVQAGKYNVEIIEPAGHAAMVAKGDAANVQNNAISEEQEGIVCINGVSAHIKAGMSPEEVYTEIRNAGELGWVNVFVTDGTIEAVTEKNLDTQGYKKDVSGYKFGSSLAFVSQNYGSDEDISITCDNEQLAQILGLDKAAGKNVTTDRVETKEYSFSKVGETDDPLPVIINTAPDAANASKKVEADAAGTIYVNGAKAEITAGMSPQEAIEALIRACNSGDVVLNSNDFTASADYSFDKGIILSSASLGLNGKINITYDNEKLGDLFGFTKMTDPQVEEKTISVEYTAKAEGEDAQVSIKEVPAGGTAEEIRKEYTGQAVVKTDGNQVVITDKSGFEMSFEVRGDVASGGQMPDPADPDKIIDTVTQLITIEATDIGTLQLQIGANEGQELAVRVPVLNTKSLYMDDLNVRKKGGPDKGMDTMDKAIGIVTAARSLMGAYENRLDYVKSGLDATEEDMTTAISRLADVDMAAEMTEYTNSNVLTQASISVLSQANDLPQQVLSLLQG